MTEELTLETEGENMKGYTISGTPVFGDTFKIVNSKCSLNGESLIGAEGVVVYSSLLSDGILIQSIIYKLGNKPVLIKARLFNETAQAVLNGLPISIHQFIVKHNEKENNSMPIFYKGQSPSSLIKELEKVCPNKGGALTFSSIARIGGKISENSRRRTICKLLAVSTIYNIIERSCGLWDSWKDNWIHEPGSFNLSKHIKYKGPAFKNVEFYAIVSDTIKRMMTTYLGLPIANNGAIFNENTALMWLKETGSIHHDVTFTWDHLNSLTKYLLEILRTLANIQTVVHETLITPQQPFSKNKIQNIQLQGLTANLTINDTPFVVADYENKVIKYDHTPAEAEEEVDFYEKDEEDDE